MARPARNALPGNILSSARTFFATTKTSQGRALLQSERNATLMIDVLRSYVAAREFRLRDFVVMPDHLHLLVTVGDGMTVERAMQRSEEHTSELQSLRHLVCRLLPEKTKTRHVRRACGAPLLRGAVATPDHPYA